jgi:hypothetical protein
MIGDITKWIDINLMKFICTIVVPSILTFFLIVLWDIWRGNPRIKFERIYVSKHDSNFGIETSLINTGNKDIPNIEYDIKITDVSSGKSKEYTGIQLPIFKEGYAWSPEAPSGISYTHRSEILERGKKANIHYATLFNDLSSILSESKYFTVMIRIRSPIMKFKKEVLCQSVSEADKPYWHASWYPHKNIRRPRWFWLNPMKVVLEIERKICRYHQLNYQKYRTL